MKSRETKRTIGILGNRDQSDSLFDTRWGGGPVNTTQPNGKKWFRTPASGVPAASSPTVCSYAEAERLYMEDTGEIVSEDPPAFENIWNGANNSVRGNDIVQCGLIDNKWVVDVEYCRN